MSKVKKVVGDIPNAVVSTGYGPAYLVYDFHISRVEGKLLTLIEGLGLRDSQEKAVKDLTRDIVQSLYRDTKYIYGEAVSVAIDKQDEITLGGTVGLASPTPPNYTPTF